MFTLDLVREFKKVKGLDVAFHFLLICLASLVIGLFVNSFSTKNSFINVSDDRGPEE